MTKKKTLSATLLRAMALGGLSLILASVSSAETHTWVGVGPDENPSGGDGANLFGPGLDGDIYVNNWNAPLVVGASLTDSDFVVGASPLTVATNLYLGASQTIKSLAFTGDFTSAPNVFGSDDTVTTNTLTFGTAGGTALSLTGATGPSAVTFGATAPIVLGYTGYSNFNVGTNGTLLIGSVISGTGGIIKTGGGTLALTTAAITNTFAGGLTINEGTVLINSIVRLGSTAAPKADAVVINGGTLEMSYLLNASRTSDVNRGFQVGSSVGTFNVTTAADQYTWTINGTIGNVAGQAGVLRKTGTGILFLGGTNTFSGGLEILGGTVSIDSTLALGAETGVGTTINGGTLWQTTSRYAVANRKFFVGSNVGTIKVENTAGAGSLRIRGVIANVAGQTGILQKTGGGILILEANNTFTGGTQLRQGSIYLAGTAAVLGGATSVTGVTVFTGAKLDGNGVVNGSSRVEAGGILSAAIYATGLVSTASPTPTNVVGAITFNGGLDISGAVSGTVASLYFDLGTVTTSDKFIITAGGLTIGEGQLGLSDFVFTPNATTFAEGTYTLFQSNSVVGSLLTADTTGVVGGREATLAINGNDIVLIVGASAVPEPATWAAIFGAAALSIAVIRRRKVRAV